MYTILQGKNEGMKKEVTDFATELIKAQSYSMHEKAVADIVEKKMIELDYDQVIKDDWGNVVGIINGREPEPTVILNSHLDTVPVNIDQWDLPPFSGKIENGKLYGVGTSDCKGGLAAQIFAGALLKRSLLPLRGNLIVAATVCEHNGSSIGMEKLIRKTLPDLCLKPNFAILGEPTNLGLYYGHDGWMTMDIKIKGPNHFKVNDAVNRIFNECDSIYKMSNGRKSIEEYRITKPDIKKQNGLENADILVSKRLRAEETGGSAIESLEKQLHYLEQPYQSVAVAVDIHKEEEYTYTGQKQVIKHITNAWSTDPYSRLMERSRQSLQAAGGEVRPGKWNLGRLGMGTAGSLLTNEFKIPTVGYGPGDEEQAHSVNEHIVLDKVYKATYGTASIVHSLVGIPVCGWTSDDI